VGFLGGLPKFYFGKRFWGDTPKISLKCHKLALVFRRAFLRPIIWGKILLKYRWARAHGIIKGGNFKKVLGRKREG